MPRVKYVGLAQNLSRFLIRDSVCFIDFRLDRYRNIVILAFVNRFRKRSDTDGTPDLILLVVERHPDTGNPPVDDPYGQDVILFSTHSDQFAHVRESHPATITVPFFVKPQNFFNGFIAL